jgi:hypothetical protein
MQPDMQTEEKCSNRRSRTAPVRRDSEFDKAVRILIKSIESNNTNVNKKEATLKFLSLIKKDRDMHVRSLLLLNEPYVAYAMQDIRLHTFVLNHVLASGDNLLLSLYCKLNTFVSSFRDLCRILCAKIHRQFAIHLTTFLQCVRDARLQPHFEDMLFFAFLPYLKPDKSGTIISEENTAWLERTLKRITSFRPHMVMGLARRASWDNTAEDLAFLVDCCVHMRVSLEDVHTTVKRYILAEHRTKQCLEFINRFFIIF